MHPGHNQKAAVVDDTLQAPAPRSIAPTNPPIAHRHLPGRARHLQAGHHCLLRARDLDQVAVGETREEALHLIRETIEFHIHGLKQDRLPVPTPKSEGEVVEVGAA